MALFGALAKNKNLSDLASAATALGNLGVTAVAAELNLLDGASTANATAGLAIILDANKRVVSSATAGTVGTGVTAVEYSGDGLSFTTVLTLTDIAETIGDNVSLAGGHLIYTFPSYAIILHGATMAVSITAADAANQSDTPDVGLGTVIGSGANALLSAVGATSENIITGQTASDCNGSLTAATAAPGLAIAVSGTKTVHFNWADGWADGDDQTATIAGTVVLQWSRLPLV